MKTWKFFADFFGDYYIFVVAFLAYISAFFSGVTFSWSSPILVKLNGTDDNPLGQKITPEQYDLLGSVFSIGGMIGPIFFTYALDLFGRKHTLTIIAVIYPIFSFVLAFSKTIYLYYISRIALGCAVAGSFSTVVVYLGEIAPTETRGIYLSVATSFILFGLLTTACMGPYLPFMTYNLFIAITSLVYVPFFVLIAPDSLYYTMQKYGSGKTLELLKKIRGTKFKMEEMNVIKASVDNEEQGNVLDLFKSRAGVRALILTSSLLLIQQLSGINVVVTYGQSLFKTANISMKPEVCAIVIAAIQTSTCFITPLASTKVGRKPLLMFSLLGISISDLLLGLYFTLDFFHKMQWLPLFSLIVFMIFYNCGIGSLPWVILGELYPLHLKAVGTTVTNSLYWISTFILTYFYNKIDPGICFLVFSGVSLVAIGYVKIWMIETRSKTFQEIQNSLNLS